MGRELALRDSQNMRTQTLSEREKKMSLHIRYFIPEQHEMLKENGARCSLFYAGIVNFVDVTKLSARIFILSVSLWISTSSAFGYFEKCYSDCRGANNSLSS